MDKFMNASKMASAQLSPDSIRKAINSIVKDLEKNDLSSKDKVSEYMRLSAEVVQYEVRLRLFLYDRVPTTEEFNAVFPGYGIFKEILEDNVVDIYNKYSERLERLLNEQPLSSYYNDYIIRLVA